MIAKKDQKMGKGGSIMPVLADGTDVGSSFSKGNTKVWVSLNLSILR